MISLPISIKLSFLDFCLFNCWNCKKLETNSFYKGARSFIFQADFLSWDGERWAQAFSSLKEFVFLYQIHFSREKSKPLPAVFYAGPSFRNGEGVFKKTREFSWKTKGLVLREIQFYKMNLERVQCICKHVHLFKHFCIILCICIKNYII